mmetsp:Transcript_53806/g.116304  ORF Transcript_53806/g.116304 Transcript_53806/m.116304 type:complete len:205 (-) Transcript_53806:507-1121(-)
MQKLQSCWPTSLGREAQTLGAEVARTPQCPPWQAPPVAIAESRCAPPGRRQRRSPKSSRRLGRRQPERIMPLLWNCWTRLGTCGIQRWSCCGRLCSAGWLVMRRRRGPCSSFSPMGRCGAPARRPPARAYWRTPTRGSDAIQRLWQRLVALWSEIRTAWTLFLSRAQPMSRRGCSTKPSERWSSVWFSTLETLFLASDLGTATS